MGKLKDESKNRSYPIRRLAIVGGVVVSLAACETTKKEIGMVAGAVGGAIAGSAVGGGKGKLVAAALGAAIGAWVGGELGKLLDQAEQRRLAESTKSTAFSGKNSTWVNPNTGTKITTKARKSEQRRQEVQIPVKKSAVKEVPPFETIGQTYISTGSINVRGGPSTDYEIVGKLRPSQNVDVVGKVENSDWYFISDAGIANGFVYAPLLKEAPEPTDIQLASADALEGDGSDDIQLASVSASSTCREVEQTVVLKDGTESVEVVEACQGPNGWEIKNVG